VQPPQEAVFLPVAPLRGQSLQRYLARI